MSRRRWTLEVCQSLNDRWMKGETIRNMAREIGASPHAMSRAFVDHGLPTPLCKEHVLATRLKVRADQAAGQCRIDGCTAEGDHRGMCSRHYQLARRFNAVDDVATPTRAAVRMAQFDQAVANGR